MSTGPRDPTGLRPAQDVVEGALTAAEVGSDDCMVLVEETSQVDVRFANNTRRPTGAGGIGGSP